MASEELFRKCDPRRFPDMSGMMTALLGAVLGQDWTDPRLVAITVTSDGHLLARAEGEIGFDRYIGLASDWRDNLRRFAVAADLTAAERDELFRLAGV